MKKLLMLAFMGLAAGPVAARCVPPPGLSIQQFYAMCKSDVDYGYSLGGSNRPSHDAWVQQVYQTYRSAQPTYNPMIGQMQGNLANTMAQRQGQYMNNFNAQGAARTNNFNQQQSAKAGQQEDELDYIRNQRTVCDTNGRCWKVPN